MTTDLKGRLARIRELGLKKATELEQAAVPGSFDAALASPAHRRDATVRRDTSFLNGWEAVGELAWTRTLRYPNSLAESLDPAVFAPLRSPRRGAPSALPNAQAPDAQGRIAAGGLRFFDLETTGLSGGTGTIAFLAAVGREVDGEFELTQVFLEDYPGESAFLHRLLSLLAGASALVSYNGRAFDMPLLRTRCVMNGIAPPDPAFHIDALFASRRLWRRVHGGASLGLLERQVLGIERAEDLPGSMIPEAWLSFASKGDNPLMHLVLSHNADDIIGLARLVARAQAVFDDPRSRAGRLDLDRFGLGRTLIAAGRADEGEELLEAAAADGEEGAQILLARRYRMTGRVADGIRLAALLPETYRCAVERAKLYERSVGDFAEAARWAKEALYLAPTDDEREAAEARMRRIARKVDRGATR